MELLNQLEKVRSTSRKLAATSDEKVSNVLRKLADLLVENADHVQERNKLDLEQMEKSNPLYDRVLLDTKRIHSIADSLVAISNYTSPIGVVLESKTLDNGLELKKVSVPLGVVGAIFEARPNVLIDTFALCLKSKNACVMKGGSQASNSNEALMELVKKALKEVDEDLADAGLLLPNDREVVAEFLRMPDYVDVIVPRGGQGLIDYVREQSLIPVIETGRGVTHTYFDKDGDTNMGAEIVFNAKTSRPSVCNSLDTLLIHKERIGDLAEICKRLQEFDVEIFADSTAFEALEKNYKADLLSKANADHFGTEFLSLKMSIKVVDSLSEAVDNINEFGSRHSEAIITNSEDVANDFMVSVDAAAVYWNASIRFTDGGVFGLGAEVGVSTQKLHARGPMGIAEMTSYKWQIYGSGQTR